MIDYPNPHELLKASRGEQITKETNSQSDSISLLFDQYPEAMSTLDRDGIFLSVNHNSEETIGYHPSELTGSFHQFIKEEDLNKAIAHFQLALQGKTQNYNCQVIHRNGGIVHLNITVVPFRENGEIVGVYGFSKNLTLQEQREEELLKIKNSLNLAQEVANIGSWDYDAETNNVFCSDSLYSILDLEKKEGCVPKYENLLSMLHPDDRSKFDQLFQRTKLTGEEFDLEYRIEKPNQTFITVHVKAVGKKDANGNVFRIIGVLHDISEQILTENRLKESEEKFEVIVNNLDVGIWSMDFLVNRLVYVSPVITKITGHKAEDFLSGKKSWVDIIHPDDLTLYRTNQAVLRKGEMVQQQLRIVCPKGSVKWVEDKVFPTFDSDGKLIRLDGIVQDISERKRNDEKIHFFAYHDYLTELPNRRLFDEKLEQLALQQKSDKFALFYLDMDRFKFVNDTLGHEVGDILLREISRRLSSQVGSNLLFRVGGDEFSIIQQNVTEKNPVELGKELLEAIEKPYKIEGYEFHLTTSIGISIFPDDGDSIKKLKMNSDAALYRAKELGKNNIQLFTKSLNCETYKRFTLENDLRKAIQKEQFVLHYQPKVEANTGEIVGAEALIRWKHPILGLVSPGEFIPLAEETGMINQISLWVVREVCRQLKEWKEDGYQIVPISFNLSAKTLMKADLVKKISQILAEFSIPTNLLEVEITEDSLIKNEGLALPTIQLLRNMGIAIAIDDFGTGYSSIGYLKKFKVDYLKIDRSFIKDIVENHQDSTIVQSIILMGKGFNLKIIAEGVETEEQLELLKSLDCSYIQGYLFSQPLPAVQFKGFLSFPQPQEKIKTPLIEHSKFKKQSYRLLPTIF